MELGNQYIKFLIEKRKKRAGGGIKGKRGQKLKGRNEISAKGKSGSDLKSFKKRKEKRKG